MQHNVSHVSLFLIIDRTKQMTIIQYSHFFQSYVLFCPIFNVDLFHRKSPSTSGFSDGKSMVDGKIQMIFPMIFPMGIWVISSYFQCSSGFFHRKISRFLRLSDHWSQVSPSTFSWATRPSRKRRHRSRRHRLGSCRAVIWPDLSQAWEVTSKNGWKNGGNEWNSWGELEGS